MAQSDYPSIVTYLYIERKMLTVANYIEISKRNFDAYSIELSRILINSCIEIHNLLVRHSNLSRCNLSLYDRYQVFNGTAGNSVKAKWRSFHMGEIVDGWQNGVADGWWDAHLEVKHDAANGLRSATLKHSIHALAALCHLNFQLEYVSGRPPSEVCNQFVSGSLAPRFFSLVCSKEDKIALQLGGMA